LSSLPDSNMARMRLSSCSHVSVSRSLSRRWTVYMPHASQTSEEVTYPSTCCVSFSPCATRERPPPSALSDTLPSTPCPLRPSPLRKRSLHRPMSGSTVRPNYPLTVRRRKDRQQLLMSLPPFVPRARWQPSPNRSSTSFSRGASSLTSSSSVCPPHLPSRAAVPSAEHDHLSLPSLPPPSLALPRLVFLSDVLRDGGCPGQTGLGKSTLINTLFASHLVDSKGRLEAEEPVRSTTEILANSHSTSLPVLCASQEIWQPCV
jgi:hypothetical protein